MSAPRTGGSGTADGLAGPDPDSGAPGGPEAAERRTRNIRCGGCDRTWTAARAEHCAACHETFSGTSSGDRHRVGRFGDGSRRCLSADEMLEAGLIRTGAGTWRAPGTWTGPDRAAGDR